MSILLPVPYTQFIQEISILNLQQQYFKHHIVTTVLKNKIFWYSTGCCSLCNQSGIMRNKLEYHANVNKVFHWKQFHRYNSLKNDILYRESVCNNCIMILNTTLQQAKQSWNLDTQYMLRQFHQCKLPQLPKVLWHIIMQFANPRYCYFHNHSR